MLELKPNCELCNKELPQHQNGAFICSYECTFCQACSEGKLAYKCPNCYGELVKRPTRVSVNNT